MLSENSASYIKYLKRRSEEIWNVWKKKVYVQRVMAGLCSMRITMWRCRSTSERKAMQQKIAELIAGMVEDGEHILLDASTTAVYIAKALKSKRNLTVVTNSIEVLIEVSDMTDWNVISLGGSLKEGFLAAIGAATIAGVKEYKVEKSIASCKAFDPEEGFYDTGDEFARTKRAMIERGDTKIMAIDSTKFEKSAFAKVMDTEDIDMIITDRKPQKTVLKVCEEKGIKCMYPEK